MMSGLSNQELVQTFLPRPIASEADYDFTISRIHELVDKGALTHDEQDYLTLLGTLVMAYEDDSYPDRDFELRGVALLKALMAEADLKDADLLPVFNTQSTVTAVLKGHQQLTTEQTNRLASYFDLPNELFVESTNNRSLILT